MARGRGPLCWGLGAALALGGCILGSRGVLEFTADYALTDIDAVRIDVPDTPIDVRGVPGQTTLELGGRWFTVGGTDKVAAENTKKPKLKFEVDDRFARLTAVLPLPERELVDLELDEITLPPDRDIELWTGLGNVVVTHMDGNISVDIERGTIFIVGGAGGVAAHTALGDVEVHSPGNIDVQTDEGDVLIKQSGVGGNDIHVTSLQGDIAVTLRSDVNLDLKVEAFRDIRVQTSTISTVSSERFEREVGNGTVKIWLTARIGSVSVTLDDNGDLP